MSAGALFRFGARTPARLIVLVWAAAIALYALGPIRYNETPRFTTWLFVAACVLTFCVGAWFATRGARTGLRRPPSSSVGRYSVDLVIRVTAVVGLFGALCIVVDKVLLAGLDFSNGVTAVRFARAAAVDAGTAGELRRSPLLYIGYFTFAFSVASFLLYLLKGDTLRRSTVVLSFIGLASIFSYSYLYGGRSPLGLVIGMAAGAIAVRLLSRVPALPKGLLGRGLFVVFLGMTVVYNNWILAERFVATNAGDYSDLAKRFETTYDAHLGLPGAIVPSAVPSPLGSAPPSATTSAPTHPSNSDQVLMQIAMNSYYATHELPMLDRTLAYKGVLGPYYGGYQFYLAAAFAARVTPWDVNAVMLPQLKSANVYGWFSTAWGGMYLDFGVLGALVATTLCGWLAGVVYRRALVDGDDAAKLLMAYVIAGIIATPVLSIFTISISLPILAALLLTAFVMHRERTVPAGATSAETPTPRS